MRLSSDSDDRSFDEWRVLNDTHIVLVWLDGIEQKKCITADDDEGFIIRIATDEDGNTVLKGDYVQYERVDGSVRIELEPRA